MSKRAKASVESKAGRAELKKLINKALPMRDRVAIWTDLAKGIRVKDDTAGVVYTKAPSETALKFLEENSTGKPATVLDVADDADFGFVIVPAQRKIDPSG